MKTDIEFLRGLEEDILAAAAGAAVPTSRRSDRRGSKVLVTALVVAFLVVAGGIGLLQSINAKLNDAATTVTNPGGGDEVYGPARNGGAPAPAPDAPSRPSPGSPDKTVVGPKIVKTANLDLVVKKGSFDRAFHDASLVAARYGGFIASSSMSDSSSRQGQLTIRVPAPTFDLALADLRALGTVQDEQVSGDEVTAQYVDLQGRIRTWEAQESVLLRLMGRAQSIQDTLPVQRELQTVQLEIEHLKGQLRVLSDQVADGTISVALHEPAAAAKRPAKRAASIYPSFRNAGRTAAAGFLDVVTAVTVGLGYLVPISLLGLGLWLAGRRIYRQGTVS